MCVCVFFECTLFFSFSGKPKGNPAILEFPCVKTDPFVFVSKGALGALVAQSEKGNLKGPPGGVDC